MLGSWNKAVVRTLVMCALGLACSAAEARKRPIIAVFNIEAKGIRLDRATLDRFSDYLATTLAASGAYRIVPRSQLKKQLVRQKKVSYRRCFDQSCQIEIGKELAAQKSTSAQIIKLGSRCVVTVTVYDLRTAATERAATAKGRCSEDGITTSVERVVNKLVGGKRHRGRVRAPEPEPEPEPEETSPEPEPEPKPGRHRRGGKKKKKDPGKRSTWLTVFLGPAIGLTEGSSTVFDFGMEFGFHFSRGPDGLGLGLLIEVMRLGTGTMYEFGGKLI